MRPAVSRAVQCYMAACIDNDLDQHYIYLLYSGKAHQQGANLQSNDLALIKFFVYLGGDEGAELVARLLVDQSFPLQDRLAVRHQLVLDLLLSD